MLPEALVTLLVDDDLMLTGRGMEALEDAVEILDFAGEIAVDVDRRVARFDVDAHIGFRLVPGVIARVNGRVAPLRVRRGWQRGQGKQQQE